MNIDSILFGIYLECLVYSITAEQKKVLIMLHKMLNPQHFRMGTVRVKKKLEECK